MNNCKECQNNYATDNEKNHSEETHNAEKPTPDNESIILALQEKLINAEKQILYMRADIENMRRNTIKEIQAKTERQAAHIILEFLDVCDNLRRCLDAAQNEPESPLKEGLIIVNKTMLKTFENLKVQIIAETGSDFDPEIHEALSYIPSNENFTEGKIISVVRPGYKLHQKVIRPAQVIVAS